MNVKDLTPWLDAGAQAAGLIAKQLPGTAGPVAQVIAVALRFASDLARQGVDPIQHIERIHVADDALRGVESEWRERLDKKFGQMPIK